MKGGLVRVKHSHSINTVFKKFGLCEDLGDNNAILLPGQGFILNFWFKSEGDTSC